MRLGRMRMDLTPLRTSRDFRLLFSAAAVFYLGGMVSYVAVPYQMYSLTGSNFDVGAIGAVELVPLVVFGLYGGALADRADRRLMLVSTGAAQAVLTAALLANAALPHPRVWVIYLVAALLSSAQSLQRPSAEALMPRTVTHGQLTAAVALMSLAMNAGALVGPAVGGVLLQVVGVAWCYAIDVAGIVTATALFARLRRYPPAAMSHPPSLSSIAEGLRYAVSRKDLLGTYVVDMVAMVMAMPITVFPAFATHVLHAPSLLGLLYAAEGIGSMLAIGTSGWTSRVHHHGRAVILAACAWGTAIALAGLAPTVWLVVAALVVAGGADMVSGLFRDVIWNQTIPDAKRGRLAGIELLSYSLGPLGGQVRAGIVADRWTVRGSIVSGGVLCVGGVLLVTAWLRGMWTYDARTDEHAARERLLRADSPQPSP